MNPRLRFLVLLFPLLAACGTNSSVQKVSQAAYRVTEKATIAQGGVSAARRKALKTADTYCRSKGKQLRVMSDTNGPVTPAGGSVTMTFMCA